jgi:hypothetical protein
MHAEEEGAAPPAAAGNSAAAAITSLPLFVSLERSAATHSNFASGTMADGSGKANDCVNNKNTSSAATPSVTLTTEELIDLKIVEVKKQFKQVTDIQTAIDVQFGDKSPFHLKVKELQSEISDIPRASGESPQLKRKFDEAQKTLKTCANFRPRTGGFFIRLFLGQVLQAARRVPRAFHSVRAGERGRVLLHGQADAEV